MTLNGIRCDNACLSFFYTQSPPTRQHKPTAAAAEELAT